MADMGARYRNHPWERREVASSGHLLQRLHAEEVSIPERLVVAPCAGVFFPTFEGVSVTCPEPVSPGEEVGTVLYMGDKHPVRSHSAGLLMGWLVLPGERVRRHQPVAWLRPR